MADEKDSQRHNKEAVSRLLQGSDKAELMEWFSDHLKDADKCFIVCGRRNDETGDLDLYTKQIGFQYLFELTGFLLTLEGIWDGEGLLNGDPDSD